MNPDQLDALRARLAEAVETLNSRGDLDPARVVELHREVVVLRSRLADAEHEEGGCT